MSSISEAIKVERTPAEALRARGVLDWPIWEKEPSTFDWHYDATEECYVLEGRVTVSVGRERVTFGAGDFVTFHAGLSCVWQVHEHLRKHYRFPD